MLFFVGDEDAKDWQITVNVHHSPVLTGTNFRATCTIKPTKRNQAPWFDLRHPAAQWYSEKCYSAIPGNCISKVGGTRTKISARVSVSCTSNYARKVLLNKTLYMRDTQRILPATVRRVVHMIVT